MQYQLLQLPRTSSSCRHHITIPSGYTTSSPESKPPITRKPIFRIYSIFSSILAAVWPVPTSRWLTVPSPPSLPRRRKVIGTLFGHRRGQVSFSVQDDPRSAPVLLIQFAVTTANLVREMSSGWVRISLESNKARTGRAVKLFNEPAWSMYCNGRKYGRAESRTCTESDWHVLSTVSSVGAGAGVVPVVSQGTESDGELMYMRARFERVVGSSDSEAFYMMGPEKSAGPEFSIFLLRI